MWKAGLETPDNCLEGVMGGRRGYEGTLGRSRTELGEEGEVVRGE